MRGTIRVAVVDAHPVVRSGLEVSLSRVPEITVICLSTSVQEVVGTEGLPAPDVVIIDSGSVSGDATRIWGRYPQARVVVFASVDSEKSMREAGQAQVQGYVPKSAPLEEVIRAVETVARGGVYFKGLRTEVLARSRSLQDPRRHPCIRLTKRERQVLGLIAEGHSSRHIAGLLSVSKRTVDSHREHIARKLGVRTVAGMTRFAIENDLLERQ